MPTSSSIAVLTAALSAASTARTATALLPAGQRYACPDTVLPGTSLFQGSTLVAYANVSNQSACCALCHGPYHDECLAWEWVEDTVVRRLRGSHNCDIFAKVGPRVKADGRVSGLTARAPPAPPPGPAPPQTGTPCHSDSDCEPQWGGAEWRCLERNAEPSKLNGCHMHATTTNTTCACQSSACGGGAARVAAGASPTNGNTTKLYVIGDSISLGMQSHLAALLSQKGWSLYHNPGNGDNTNYGAHCVQTWLPEASSYDVISFQFGLHDIAYDEERLTASQYKVLLANITQHLVNLQRIHGTKLLWVKTTPVPTVAAYGFECNGSATVCLNPARFDTDVVKYNAAAEEVVTAAIAQQGARISTADLYGFVSAKCGGQGYEECRGFQLPNNVHFTPEGWGELAAFMQKAYLEL